MSSSVPSYKHIKLTNVEISKFTPGSKKMKMGIANLTNTATNSRKFMFSTPVGMRAPFGASTFDTDNPTPKYNFSLSLDPDTDDKIEFRDFLIKLDDKICQEVTKNETMLKALKIPPNKKNILDLVKSKYSGPLVKEDINGKYPPMFPTKLYRNSKTKVIETICQIEKEKTQINDENVTVLLPRGCTVRCIVQIAYLWVVSGNFGANIQVLRCVVDKGNEVPIAQLRFSSDEDDDDDDDQQEVQDVQDKIINNGQNNNDDNNNEKNDEDSKEEEEEEEEEDSSSGN